MGPRPHGRGRRLTNGRTHVAEVLQWGRALTGAEGAILFLIVFGIMLLQWGRALTGAEGGPLYCFMHGGRCRPAGYRSCGSARTAVRHAVRLAWPCRARAPGPYRPGRGPHGRRGLRVRHVGDGDGRPACRPARGRDYLIFRMFATARRPARRLGDGDGRPARWRPPRSAAAGSRSGRPAAYRARRARAVPARQGPAEVCGSAARRRPSGRISRPSGPGRTGQAGARRGLRPHVADGRPACWRPPRSARTAVRHGRTPSGRTSGPSGPGRTGPAGARRGLRLGADGRPAAHRWRPHVGPVGPGPYRPGRGPPVEHIRHGAGRPAACAAC